MKVLKKPDESRAERYARRAVTIPGFVAAAFALAGLLPALLPVALAYDAARKAPWTATRSLLFAQWYLACEVFGLCLCGFGWLAVLGRTDSARSVALHRRFQESWARALVAGGQRIFGFTLDVVGEVDVPDGPFLLFVRHASLGDTVLPIVLLQARHGVALRYVIKRELLWDPCLDLCGQRIPNSFVRRDSGDPAREIEVVRRLASDLGPREAVMIYPEGTRFTPEKRERALARLAERGPAELRARAEKLQHVLPPRPGGPLALLADRPDADVLLCAHVGFEGAATLRELWSGALVGRHVRVRFFRTRASDRPRDREALAGWLYEQWERVDAWVGEALPTSLPEARRR
jgi:1-acyl-sn-glycerol-3-phosphate acyltransferase